MLSLRPTLATVRPCLFTSTLHFLIGLYFISYFLLKNIYTLYFDHVFPAQFLLGLPNLPIYPTHISSLFLQKNIQNKQKQKQANTTWK